jgi:hypothetical protein
VENFIWGILTGNQLAAKFLSASFSMNEILAKSNITVTPHTPYSPHLVLYDFSLFPNLTDDVTSKKI